MAENRFHKLIASIVAIFVYLSLAYSLISYMKSDIKPKKDYGFNVKDAIVVNIDSLLKETPKPIKKTPPKIKPIKKVVQKEIVKIEPPKIVESIEEEKVQKDSRDKSAKSAKDLFSTVRTDQYKKTMREHQKQEEARASRLKKQKAQKAKKVAEKKRKKELEKKQKRAEQLIEQMNISKPSAHKKSGETHEFWSFVSNKIMAKWQRTIATYDGLTSTVVIRIDSQGRLTYSELSTSGSPLFDTKLKTFLDNLEYERFPSYKYGSFIEAEFEFTDKERGI
jgi:hypothetical protein